jgi:hypothetical protein
VLQFSVSGAGTGPSVLPQQLRDRKRYILLATGASYCCKIHGVHLLSEEEEAVALVVGFPPRQ